MHTNPDAITLSSSTLSAEISCLGAELVALHFAGQNILWHGDPAFWPDPIGVPDDARQRVHEGLETLRAVLVHLTRSDSINHRSLNLASEPKPRGLLTQ